MLFRSIFDIHMESRELLLSSVTIDGGGEWDAVPTYTGMEEIGRRNQEIRDNNQGREFARALRVTRRSEQVIFKTAPWAPPDLPEIYVPVDDPPPPGRFQVMIRVAGNGEYVELEVYEFSDTYQPYAWTEAAHVNTLVLFFWGQKPPTDMISHVQLAYSDAPAAFLGYFMAELFEVVNAEDDFDIGPDEGLGPDVGGIRYDLVDDQLQGVFNNAPIRVVEYDDI